MLALTGATRSVGTHPLWHLLIVAAGATATFAGIKAHEYRQHAPKHPRPRRPATPRSATSHASPPPREAVTVLAALSIAASAIHANVCAPHFEEAIAFGVFFVIASTLQAAWALIALWRPTRRLLITGTVGNAGLILVWAVTRTVGLPLGPDTWRPEAIRVADLLATLVELSIVIGAWYLLAPTARHRVVRARNA
jgi:hypothetical protein